MISKPPIFIMSSERSGSNLLRVLLGNHSQIAAPVAPHLLSHLSELARFYTPLTDINNAEALFSLIKKYVNHQYYNWNFTFDFNDLSQRGTGQNFMDFFHYFYTSHTEATWPDKSRIVVKENAIFDFCFQLLNKYPNAKFIYLYRDPRDYVASWMKVPFGFYSHKSAIMNWVDEQKKCDLAVNAFGLSCYYLKYEDLISDTEKHVGHLLDFLNEERENSCYATKPTASADYSWNEYWKNLEKPVIKDNKGKFLETLDSYIIAEVQNYSWEYMLKLGYEPVAVSTEKKYFDISIRKLKEIGGKSLYKIRNTSASYKTTEDVLSDKSQLLTELRNEARHYFDQRQN